MRLKLFKLLAERNKESKFKQQSGGAGGGGCGAAVVLEKVPSEGS